MGETMRDAFGKRLAALGAVRPELVVLDADVSSSSKSSHFATACPERFFNVGVAEANLVDVAAGLSTAGFRPVANAFAIFLALKGADQIRNVLCYNDLPVVLAGAYGGLSDSFDGASHQSIADIAMLRALPGLTVLVPSSNADAERALELALSLDGPAYIRLNRNECPTPAGLPPLAIGASRLLRAGSDVTIAANGICSAMALEAAKELAGEGISAEVIDVASVKPFGAEELAASVAKTGRLVTLEEHSRVGGTGTACLEALASRGVAFRAELLGVDDRFTESGPYAALLNHYGISATAASRAARRLLGAGERTR
jgi:transketolase